VNIESRKEGGWATYRGGIYSIPFHTPPSIFPLSPVNIDEREGG